MNELTKRDEGDPVEEYGDVDKENAEGWFVVSYRTGGEWLTYVEEDCDGDQHLLFEGRGNAVPRDILKSMAFQMLVKISCADARGYNRGVAETRTKIKDALGIYA